MDRRSRGMQSGGSSKGTREAQRKEDGRGGRRTRISVRISSLSIVGGDVVRVERRRLRLTET
nr:unnamed protein product [Digitaria exilis]